MKTIRRRGTTQVYHLFQSLLSLVKGLPHRVLDPQVDFSPNGNTNLVGVRVDNQSRAEALAHGEAHTFAGSIVSGMYKSYLKPTAEAIDEAKVAGQFGYHRRFFTGKLIDVFVTKAGDLCINLGGVVTRRSQTDPNRKMWRTFNLERGELLNVAVEVFAPAAKPSAVKASVKALAKIKAKRVPKAKPAKKVKP
jgi:hypothetical protein